MRRCAGLRLKSAALAAGDRALRLNGAIDAATLRGGRLARSERRRSKKNGFSAALDEARILWRHASRTRAMLLSAEISTAQILVTVLNTSIFLCAKASQRGRCQTDHTRACVRRPRKACFRNRQVTEPTLISRSLSVRDFASGPETRARELETATLSDGCSAGRDAGPSTVWRRSTRSRNAEKP